MSPENVSALILSLRVATVATLLNAAVGIPLAYLLARRTFRACWLVDLLVTLPLVLPPTVTGYYLIVLLGRRGWLGAPLYGLTGWSVAFTWYAAVIAAAVMALPLLVRTSRAAIESAIKANPEKETELRGLLASAYLQGSPPEPMSAMTCGPLGMNGSRVRASPIWAMEACSRSTMRR